MALKLGKILQFIFLYLAFCVSEKRALSLPPPKQNKNYRKVYQRDTVPSKFYSSLTYSVNDTGLRFFVVGDWGGQEYDPFYTETQKEVAASMAKKAADASPHFVLALGDNFYDYGVSSYDDSRFHYTFDSIYNQPSLNIPWFFLAGNHDWHGTVYAQIRHSELSWKWNFPNYFYTLHYQVNNVNSIGQVNVDIVMIDTELLCEITPNATEPKQQDYVKWIGSQLSQSKANFLFVAGHRTMFSTRGNNNCLIQVLNPLLRSYNVQAYLSGHTHNLQYIQVMSNNDNEAMNYIVSGNAHSVEPDSKIEANQLPKDSLKFAYGNWHEKKGGYVYIHIQSQVVARIFFINSDGKQVYSNYLFGKFDPKGPSNP